MLDMIGAATSPDSAAYAFGRFVLRRRERALLADGVPVEVGSRAVEVLLALVEADGALLTKGYLLDRVWPDVVVEENNLQVQISALRRALGPEHRGWIATAPGRGYRFTGPVGAPPEETPGMPAMSRSAPVTEPARFSLLVLPFAGRGDGPARAWFADAVTDSLTTDLARALPPGSTVAAQTTADTYRDHPVDVRAIGREQGVRYVVEGSVLLVDDLVRVNAQLITAATGAHLCADRFDVRWANGALRVQDEIVGRIARSVSLSIMQSEAQRAGDAEREHPGEGTAEDYVLLARAAAYAGTGTREGIEAARDLYARALERDPGNADALAGIACVRVQQALNELCGTEPVRRDDTVARDAYLAEAEEKLSRALAASPGHLPGHEGPGGTAAGAGRLRGRDRGGRGSPRAQPGRAVGPQGDRPEPAVPRARRGGRDVVPPRRHARTGGPPPLGVAPGIGARAHPARARRGGRGSPAARGREQPGLRVRPPVPRRGPRALRR